MLLLSHAVPSLPMAKKDESLVQLGVRVRQSVRKALVDFSADHPLQPALANIVERAILEYVERERPKLPKPPAKTQKDR